MNSEQPKTDVEIRDSWLLLVLALVFTWWLLGLTVQSVTLRRALFALLTVSLLMKQRWVIYLTVVYCVFVSSIVPQRLGGFATYLFVIKPLVLMGYLIFSLRFTDRSLRFRLGFDGQGWWTQDQNQTLHTLHSTRPLTSGIIWVPLALVGAAFFLMWIPIDPTTDVRWGIRPAPFRAFAVLWFLAFSWLMISGVFWWFAERDPDPFRARVYMRSLFCKESHRELSPIVKTAVRKQARKTS